MARIIIAVCLISFGLGSLFKSLHWFPAGFCQVYQEWIRQYWPVLVILAGIRFLVKDRSKPLEMLLGILILSLVGLWILCGFWGQQSYVNV